MKVVLRLDPRLATTVIIATEIPAAMSPYSIAVAPVSSRTKCRMVLVTVVSFRLMSRPREDVARGFFDEVNFSYGIGLKNH